MAQPNGETFTLLRGVSTLDISDLVKYHVVSFDGLGMPPVRRLTQRGPMQNGDTDVGYRLDPRYIRISVLGLAGVNTAMHDRREELLGFLRPGNDVISLRWTYADTSGTQTMQIDTHYNGGLSMSSDSLIRYAGRYTFELRAADPTFYDPNGVTVQFPVSYSGTGGTVPIAIPFFVGSTSLNVATTATLSGDNAWIVYPTFTIVGPVTDFKVVNNTTGEKLDFTGNSVGGGSTWTIDTRFGYKTVTDQSSTNQISKLTTDSNLATFHLEPGVNSLSVTGTGPSSATSVTMQYYPRYLGA